jgi:hypothetical protein
MIPQRCGPDWCEQVGCDRFNGLAFAGLVTAIPHLSASAVPRADPECRRLHGPVEMARYRLDALAAAQEIAALLEANERQGWRADCPVLTSLRSASLRRA